MFVFFVLKYYLFKSFLHNKIVYYFKTFIVIISSTNKYTKKFKAANLFALNLLVC